MSRQQLSLLPWLDCVGVELLSLLFLITDYPPPQAAAGGSPDAGGVLYKETLVPHGHLVPRQLRQAPGGTVIPCC